MTLPTDVGVPSIGSVVIHSLPASTAPGTPNTDAAVPVQGVTGGVPILSGTPGAQVRVTPTIHASLYTAFFPIGGVLTFANALSPTTFGGMVESIAINFKGSAPGSPNANYDFVILSAAPAGTYADFAAPTYNAADSALILDVLQLTIGYGPLGTHAVFNLDGVGKFLFGTSTSLFGIVVVAGTGTPPTPASTSDMSVTMAVGW